MRLAELSSLAERRAADLVDLQTELGNILLNDPGDEPNRLRAGRILREVMELWDEVDEMTAHVMSIKSRINIPELGMSILDAEVVASSFARREEYVEGLLGAISENIHSNDPGGNPESSESVPCPHCGMVRGTPIDPDDAIQLLRAIRGRRVGLNVAIERATWQVETTWCDDDDDVPEMASTSVPAGVAVDPVQMLGIGELDGEILRPAPGPSVGTDFEVVDPRCPFCMSPGREGIERSWMRDGADTMAIMAYATGSGAIPRDVNPTVARIHFDDHFKPSDHVGVHGR